MFNLFIASLTFNYMFENVLPGTTLGSALFASGICAKCKQTNQNETSSRAEDGVYALDLNVLVLL